MKMSKLAFLVSFLVLITFGLWLSATEFNLDLGESLQFLIVILLIVFGFFIAIRRLKSEKRGEPAEDELSKKIVQKASSISFFISLYLWLGIMYIADKKTIETDILFGWGILGMAVIFAISWLVISKIGIKSE